MNFLTILTLAAGLSMDAFAVAIYKGLAMKEITWKKAAIVGLWFGGFQAMMPMAGYLLGVQFKESITSIDHWIAFVLLGLIGINMIKEACSKEEDVQDGSLGLKEMLVLAVATSIDAMAVGVTFAFLKVTILPAVTIIGCTTCILSLAGVCIGQKFGGALKSKAALAGGVILCFIGLKILLEHLGLLG